MVGETGFEPATPWSRIGGTDFARLAREHIRRKCSYLLVTRMRLDPTGRGGSHGSLPAVTAKRLQSFTFRGGPRWRFHSDVSRRSPRDTAAAGARCRREPLIVPPVNLTRRSRRARRGRIDHLRGILQRIPAALPFNVAA